MRPLNILHVFRAPIGGLFRHVLDLMQGQVARGHRVGLIFDSTTGDARAETALAELAPRLAFSLTRIPMRRQGDPRDLAALVEVIRRANQCDLDILHGHGAKGGAYARLAFTQNRVARVYTPHGGTLLLNHDLLANKFYLLVERLLMPYGHLYLFESDYIAQMFRDKIGVPRGVVRVVHNGVRKADFAPIALADDATDLVFLGEFRPVKGIDVLIDALAQLRKDGRPLSLTLIGNGPEAPRMRAQIAQTGLESSVRILPPMAAAAAFAKGRVIVAPSRAESLPYVVLEALAAGKPLVTTRVGGIPEIYGPFADTLVPPGDQAALAAAIAGIFDSPGATADVAVNLQERMARSFSVDSMVEAVLDAYEAVLELAGATPAPALSHF